MADIVEWMTISVLAVILLAIYIWPHLKKQPSTIDAENKKEKSSHFPSPDDPNTRNAVIAIIITATVAISTLTINKFLNTNVVVTDWYWIIVVAGITICLVGWVQKRIQIESAKVVCIIVLCIALPMLILNTIWPWTTLEGLREKFAANPAPAPTAQSQPQKSYTERFPASKWKKLNIEWKKGQEQPLEVDILEKGQEYYYLGSDEIFESQIDNGKTSCWREITPADFGKKFTADWSGKFKLRFAQDTNVQIVTKTKT